MVTMDATAIDRATDHVALTALQAHVEDFAAYVRARRDVVRADRRLADRGIARLADERRIPVRDVVTFGDEH